MSDRLFDSEPERPLREYPRDAIWDSLQELFGEPRTRSERGRRNRACRELREAGATADEIRVTYDYCRSFPKFTEMALCGWLSRALHEKEQGSSVEAAIDRIFREAAR